MMNNLYEQDFLMPNMNNDAFHYREEMMSYVLIIFGAIAYCVIMLLIQYPVREYAPGFIDGLGTLTTILPTAQTIDSI